MTQKQMEALGFHKHGGDRYSRWDDAREIEIRVYSHDTLRDVWGKIYDVIYEAGVEEGKRQMRSDFRKLLNLEE